MCARVHTACVPYALHMCYAYSASYVPHMCLIQTVLVHSAAGGVGLASLEIVAAHHATAIATIGSAVRCLCACVRGCVSLRVSVCVSVRACVSECVCACVGVCLRVESPCIDVHV